MQPDKRTAYKYRGVIVLPRPPKGLLRRHWKIDFGGLGWLLVNTKIEAERVIDSINVLGHLQAIHQL